MAIGPLSGRKDLLPSLGIVAAGVLWGLFWLPIRALGDLGLEGAWPGTIVFAAAAVIMIPLLAFRWRFFCRYWRALILCGLFSGTAFACYATSLLMTEVVRTILLFYLSPIWATLLGILLLGERLTLGRGLALVLGFGGMLVILGIGAGFPWPRNLGDWLALASGLAWAYGSLLLYQKGGVSIPEQVFAFIIGSLIVSALALYFGGEVFGGPQPLSALVAALPLTFLILLYLMPMMFLTIWPATRLSPGRLGILLLSDVVVGVASAAAFSGEPFGLRELLGTALIISAAFVEIVVRPTSEPDPTETA